jgi:hypothetical protein
MCFLKTDELFQGDKTNFCNSIIGLSFACGLLFQYALASLLFCIRKDFIMTLRFHAYNIREMSEKNVQGRFFLKMIKKISGMNQALSVSAGWKCGQNKHNCPQELGKGKRKKRA